MTEEKYTCAVTGANGYLGSRIATYLNQKDWEVYQLTRDKNSPKQEKSIYFSLENKLNPTNLADIDVLIHCAYDFKQIAWKDIYRSNVEGSLQLFQSAIDAGVKKIIFISTMSAYEDCQSLYGRAKLTIEKGLVDLTSKYQDKNVEIAILRPGLIYGKQVGGMVGSLSKVLSISPIVPLIGRGDQILYLSHQQDLCQLITQLCSTQKSFSVPIIAANENGKTFKEILQLIAGAKQKKVIFIPVPWRLMWLVIKISENIGIGLFRSDSIVSLVNQDLFPSFEVTKQLGGHFRKFSTDQLA